MLRLIFSCLLVLLCFSAEAATELPITVCPSGCGYTSLEAAMNANEQNLVTADKYMTVAISGTWSSADTTAVTIHNYTTDATHYINIYTTGSARHQGKYSTSYYRLLTGAYTYAITISAGAEYLTLDGIQAGTHNSSNGYSALRTSSVSSTSSILISNSIFYPSGYFIVRISSGTVEMRNCISNAISASAITVDGGAVTLNNVTAIALGAYNYGITRSSGTLTANNCYSYSYSSGYAYNGTMTCNSCAASDSTAPGTSLDNIPYSTSTFINVTSGSEDLHLVAGSGLIDKGADLSATFTTDIDGQTRSAPWDIGADEYQATSAYTPHYILY